MENTEKENPPKQTWYERVFETTDLNFSNPKFDPYLNVDKYPEWLGGGSRAEPGPAAALNLV
jgi:hypothetical protein